MTTLPDQWRLQIPQEWGWAKLTHVSKLGTGHTPDRNKPEYWLNCDIPWVTAADLSKRPSAFTPLHDTEQKISEVGLANSAAVLHPSDTVMFCRTASVGLFCITGIPMATTQAFVTWTPGPTLNSRYLLYVISAMAPEFDRLAYGSTHMTIYMPDLEAIRIPVPSLEEQSRIARFLDDQTTRVDQIIGARRELVRLIVEQGNSEIARTLLGGGSSCKAQSGGGSWFEGLPKEWSVRPLRSEWSVIDCKHRTPAYLDEGYPVVSPGDVTPARLDLTRCHRFVADEDYFDLADDLRRCRVGDIVYSRNASAGTAALVDTPDPFTMGQDVCRITSRRSDQKYLFYVLNHVVEPQLEAARIGSTFTRINVDQIKSLVVPVPPDHEQERLAGQADETNARTSLGTTAQQRQIDLLQEFKRSLISAAVSGEFDVSAASGRGVPV